MRRRIIHLLGWSILLGLGWWASCSPAGPNGHTGLNGSYLNLGSDVQYTGMSSCQPCHQSIYNSYLQTGMGHSLYRPNRSEAIEHFGPEVAVFDAYSGYAYHPYWQGDSLYILEFQLSGTDTVYQRRERVDYIVGSGHQTRSYLLERNRFFFEVPITWYVSRQTWDLSPGYEGGNNSRFDRAIGEECMACHTGHIDFEEGSVNRFRQVSLGIDCEKCHGPGSAHIRLKEAGELVDVGREIDYSIVNPAKLGIQLQFDVCKQCHLQGVVVPGDGHSVTDFRPGMPLTEVYDLFIERFSSKADFGIASHAERLMKSSCFLNSEGQLTCTTCHDPHQSLDASDPLVYVRQCQGCHATGDGLDCGVSPEMMASQSGDCIACHMPKGGTSDIPHVTFTDHHIRVVEDSLGTPEVRRFLGLVCMTDSQPSTDIVGKAYLLYFERHSGDPEHLELAGQKLAPGSHEERSRLFFHQQKYRDALREIDLALQTQPGDHWLRYRKAEILEADGQLAPALEIYREVYREDPDHLEAGLKTGVLILKTATNPPQALAEARQVFGQCLQTAPFDKRLHMNLGFVELNAGNYAAAQKHLDQALAYDPRYVQALENMVFLKVQLGDKASGRLYLDKLLFTQPNYPKKGMMLALVEE